MSNDRTLNNAPPRGKGFAALARPGNTMKRITTLIVLAAGSIGVGNAQVQSVEASGVVSHGAYAATANPSCMAQSNISDVINTAAQIIASSQKEGFSYLGAALEVINKFHDDFRSFTGMGGWLNEVVTGIYGDSSASCKPFMAVIPAGSQIVGYSYDAWDNYGSGACDLTFGDGFACKIGWSAWQGPPQVTAAGNSLIVTGMFMNWSDDRERGATMTIRYVQPNNGQPNNSGIPPHWLQ
jgi:hypothetical protein